MSTKSFTLQYWMDDGWHVGRLKEFPAVMSQGETLLELQANIREAYRLMVEDAEAATPGHPSTTEVLISV